MHFQRVNRFVYNFNGNDLIKHESVALKAGITWVCK